MTINRAHAAIVLALTLGALAGCDGPAPRAGERTPQRAAPQVPAPLPAHPRPAPPVAVATPSVPPPPAIDWRDAPLPAGDWQWLPRSGGSQARFGPPGQPPLLILTCDRAAASVELALPATGPAAAATITTSTASASYPAALRSIGTLSALVVVLPVNDRMLDAMAFSRGRFRLHFDNGVELVAPSWAEVGRVVEDCRG